MPVLLSAHPARRHSVRVECAPRPGALAPRAAAALMRQAERDPRLDLEALAVLRALLFSFTSWSTGHCAPSLQALARAARVSRATVCRRLAMLVGCGLVVRVRRAVLVGARQGWRGLARWCQATTQYLFPTARAAVPAAAQGRPDSESQAAAPFSRDKNSSSLPAPAREADGVLDGLADIARRRHAAWAAAWLQGRRGG